MRRTGHYLDGQPMTAARLALATGYATSAVFAWVRQMSFAQVVLVKGMKRFNGVSPTCDCR
ncbi:MAG: hypothetical protein ACU0B9_07445 [Limimaricola soesokkakensis]|uniref:hypothetical protein n=1 Tax=Limimaricola soesokkakensis TaxID=1343159 RepID=UPI00405A09B4